MSAEVDALQAETDALVARCKRRRRRKKRPPPAALETSTEPLSFGAQVEEGSSFVPTTTTTTRETLERERERLARLEKSRAAQAALDAIGGLERCARKFVLARDLAAVQVQRRVRGMIGRFLARHRREERAVEAKWVEVCDRQSGEHWYHNTLTGESSWDPPEGLRGVVPVRAEQVNLPPLVPSPQKKTAPLVARTPRVYEDECGWSLSEEPEINEDEKVLSSSSSNIVRPDGSVSKVRLREAVMETLRHRTFDSVSTVARKTTTFLHYSKNGARPRVFPVYDQQQHQYMAAVPVLGAGSPTTTRRQGRVAAQRSLAIRDVPHAGFEISPPTSDAVGGFARRACFNCWSSGQRSCALHREEKVVVESSSSVLMCQNWDLFVLEQKYRAEGTATVRGLRYDRERKGFVPTIEHEHPIYREVARLVRDSNFTKRRRWHQYCCIMSIVEQLRVGNVEGRRADASSKLLVLKRTMRNRTVVTGFTKTVLRHFPVGPCSEPPSDRVALVKSPPLPFPAALYSPRAYALPAPRTVPMPKPPSPGDGDSSTTTTGLEALRAAKYPSPHTVCFATFSRKPRDLAIGGLPAELAAYQLVQAIVPPQFGNLTVMERLAILCPLSDERVNATWYDTFKCPPANQIFVYRMLEHLLNSRMAPTIAIATRVRPSQRHAFGTNRPEQTGEDQDLGFRTSTHAAGYDLVVVASTILVPFVPGADVASPNLPSAGATTTTRVDTSYPFCEPSTRPNTTLDHYHLCLVDQSSPNREQVFTVLGAQDVGRFMLHCDAALPLGPFHASIYRSWSFQQRDRFEEFFTDDGVAYFYDRRAGETFWERPLADCEKKSVIEGGVRVDPEDNFRDSTSHYPTHEVRKLTRRHCETEDEIVSRRRTAALAITIARDDGTLPLPKHDRQRETTSIPPPPGQEQPGVVTKEQTTAALALAAAAAPQKPKPKPKPPPPEPKVESPREEAKVPETAATLAASITAALLPALSSAAPVDLLKLGLGLGMGLGANSTLKLDIIKTTGELAPEDRLSETQVRVAKEAQDRALEIGLPIGVAATTVENPERDALDRAEEDETQQQNLNKTTLTKTPDERTPSEAPRLGVDTEAIARRIPVVAHPDYYTHPVAASSHRLGDEPGSLLRRVAEALPDGFFAAIHATHVGPAKCDYLPWIPNLPASKPIGRIKPRSAAEDWYAVGFDPWSAGKEPLSTEFVRSLHSKADAVLEAPPNATDDSFIDVMDRHGLALQENEAAQASKLAEDFETLASWARHGKYREIEDAMNQPDWLLPIDYQDALGNSLLSIAVQNGNKRIAKLCLRRGANINLANNTGQTVLHYAYAYGFEDLAEYCKTKGADDTILNADGLTCYEGLSLTELDSV
ncbi:hypothetical protein CTAYLR_004125 [Chrysophaeum taylorii]|uniref:WW domain-containing protein n=1 Tax=Chrysophaeum taylorii TaxID=2483200 RepID=A0AAD7XID1_9STRA|nr:hypothetical protein CTAYLR_004125 [Chrysophaeum taylorii]